MARRLLDAGYAVIGWNRTPAKTAPFVEAGGRLAATPAEAAAQVETVIVMVSDPAALIAVTEGPDGVLSGVRPGAQLIVMATVGPAAIARLISVTPAQVDLLDAPVLGSLVEAAQGKLQIFASGSIPSIQRAASLLAVLGSVTRVGGLGAGSAAKLVANGTLFGMLGLLGEALALAQTLGLSRETAFEVLAATPLAEQAERRRPALEAGEFVARFSLALARKDADLLLAAAASAGSEIRLAGAATSWLADAERSGLGEKDYTAVLAAILNASRPSRPKIE
jgi:3-hydroxyisobutyrate dehydrogenase-like beta-hydroxyacid dehydrogenase